jgi:hypothetical protein
MTRSVPFTTERFTPKPDGGGGENRPTIRLAAGETERIVDEAELALIRANRGLYQRDNSIVFVGSVPAISAHSREITVQRIFERGEHALIEDLGCAAHFERWDGRVKAFVPADPPIAIAKTLRQRVGKLRFPILAGIINAPTLRADGSIFDKPGYDASTGLLFDALGVDFPKIPDRPTRADAQRAFGMLDDLIGSFPFVDSQARAVALSAILTACIRRSLPTAPLHATTAPVAGSGKSKLVDIASVIATGHEAAVISQGHEAAELEKRLGALLLAGDAMISIDNCEQPLGGELLCQILTQARVRTRVLGASSAPELSAGSFVAATGNNLIILGDLTRRAIQCRLDPKLERPETRVFDSDPVTDAKKARPRYVVAVITILRAYIVAGRPGRPTPLGSFEAWSDLVRGALIWLGAGDPVETMNDLRRTDPRLEEAQTVISQWRAAIGTERVTAAQVIKAATRQNGYDSAGSELVHADFRDALLAVAGHGGAINGRRLGKWLSSHAGRIINGFRFEHSGNRDGAAMWVLQDCEAKFRGLRGLRG